MMKKVTGYRLQVTGFVLAAIVVMFVAPTTASAAPTASIRAGQNDTFTATANGTNLSKIDIYRTPTGYASWTYMGTGYCSGSSCSYSVSWDPSSTGTRDWYFVVNAFDSTGQCTGNPWTTFPNPTWSNCGANDYTGMTPPSATNPSASCPIPGSTASLSWSGASGASRYDVYVQDLAYGSLNWNTAACGSNGLVVCSQVNGTSYSASNLTPGANYQWYVFACNGWGCSAPASYSTTFSCTSAPTPPTPTISSNPICTPGNTSSMYTISWASVSPAVSYIDISTDPNFSFWYNKYVAGSTSTSASSGFNGMPGTSVAGQLLTLQPNTTYYVRTWNGYKNSGTASFTTPVSCTCSGYNTIDVPTEGATYTMGNAYTSSGWGTFCSGPNGTNRNRVDPYICDQGTWSNCRYIGPTSSIWRQDVVNASWTCGNLNSNSDGWSFNFTPDSTYLGNKTLRVASINDAATSCLVWDARNINIVAPTPPTPSATVNSSCTSSDTSSLVTLSWASASPQVTWVDISTDNFASGVWYNKYVAGSTSTSASSGFAYNGNPLTLQPNTTYYIRTWNGYRNSGSSSFTTPSICPPNPPTNPIGSCPVPGSTANVSWTPPSGGTTPTRYDVFAFDLSYGSPNWSACGANGLIECRRVNGTSYSFPTTPGKNYQWFVDACVGDGGNCSSTVSNTFTCLTNNAQYVSQSCPPSNMTPGQTANVSVIMRNSGNTTWPASSTYRLGSQNPQDNTTWGFGRIIPGSSIPPGSNYTFSSTATAPSTPGTYNFQWRMVQDGVQWFGDTTSNCSVTVAYPPPPTANLNSPTNDSFNIIGQTMTVSATAAGTNLNKVNIYRAPATSDLTQSSSWTLIAENDSCAGSSICGISTSWTPSVEQTGQWVIAVNAFDNYGRNCSGMGSSGGYWTAACNRNGSTSNVTISVGPPPPRASVSGPGQVTVGYNATLTASLTGSARSGQLWITKGDGQSTFSCPQGPNGAPIQVSNGRYWCPVARGDNTTNLSGTYQFRELGTYTAVVNAFSSTNQTGTGPSDQCSGTPSSLGFNSAVWSDCGVSDTFTTTVYRPPTPSGNVGSSCIPEATISWANSDPAVTYVDISEDSNFSTFYNKYVAGTTSTSASSGFNLYPTGTTPLILKPNTTYYLRSWNGYDISYPPSSFRTNDCPPRGSVSGPSAMAVGDNLTFSAALSGSARSGQIWITKGDGRSTFSCPQGEGGVPYRASTGYYWCPVARQDNTTSLSGTYTFAEPGSYTSVVNAFSNPYQLGTGPSDECSGTPTSLGFNSGIWSDCGTSDNVVTINAAPRASVSGPSTIMRGETATYTATLSGGARSAALWITKGDGRSVFPCLSTIYYASTGRFWCNIGSGSESTVTGTYPFVENGAYTVVVNAYANSNQTGTAPSDQCSGTPTELGVNPTVWSDCGANDNVATTVTYGPAATLTGSSRGTKGAPSTFTATLLGSAQSAQIWITKGDGTRNFYCNGAENNATQASNGYWWCNIGSGSESTVTGTYTFPDTDRYTAAVNAFTNTNTTYTGNPSTECTGTPTYLGFNSSTWSDCGANDFVVVTSSAPTATNCGGGTSPRAEGLVTSPSLEIGSKFGTTTTGRCVVDSATEFSPFKIPSYEDLKFIYYTQSKATKTEITPSSGTANQGTLRSALNNYDTVLIRGNLNIGANLGGASKTAVVFVDGDLNIDTPTFTFGDASSGLVFVVGGNVIINRSVTRIDAVIISGGTIYTADACSIRNSIDAQQLIVNGSLVSLDTGNIVFCRALSDNLLPAEKINSDPKYLVILRNLYADIVQRWSEIP